MTSEERRYRATVARRTLLSPHMVRVTLGDVESDAGAGQVFHSSGHADEFVSIEIPSTDASEEAARRYYSIREWRAEQGELDIDFVLHGHGPASAWAAVARAGEIVSFTYPRGNYLPPEDAQWIALVGDATALPAIARILDERVGGPAVHVIIALDDERDRPSFALRKDDSIRWLTDDEAIVDATIAFATTAADGYLWFSGEASEMRAVRTHLRKVLGWPNRQWTTMAYWRRDWQRWRDRFDSHGPELAERFEGIFETDADPEEQRDRADALLERYGL